MPPRMPIEDEQGTVRCASGSRQPRATVQSRERRGQDEEVEDDGAGPLRLGQAADLDRGAGRAEGADEGEHGAEGRAGRQAAGEVPTLR